MSLPILIGSSKILTLETLEIDYPCNVKMLAPHPDDFDAIGITMQRLLKAGCNITLSVITGGANGVVTGFDQAKTHREKEEVRKQEQLASCRFFGLEEAKIEFIKPKFNADGTLAVNEINTRTFRTILEKADADIICLPHWNDSNMTHQRVFALYCRACRFIEKSHTALLNQDSKTRDMSYNLIVEFNEDEANWKRELLSFHSSQQSRNQQTRGISFDERVLQLNHTTASQLGVSSPYAEVFSIVRHNA